MTALCQEEPGCTDINVPGGSASVCHRLRSSPHYTFDSAVGAGCRVVKFYCSDLEQSYEVSRTGQYPSIPVSENGVYSVHQFAGSTTLIAAAAPGSAGPADLGREY